jgi:hypothetical protein
MTTSLSDIPPKSLRAILDRGGGPNAPRILAGAQSK